MSTHEVKVVRIESISKHPNADKLEIIDLYGGGFTAISRLGQFKLGDLAVYIEPDYVVPSEGPNAHLFAFLEGKTRIRSRKLRGIGSQGLLIEALEGMSEGDNVMDLLGIVRYEPPMRGYFSRTHGLVQSERDLQLRDAGCVPTPPALRNVSKYDLESLRKNLFAFVPEENVVATEKIHGANARFCFTVPKQPKRVAWDSENTNANGDPSLAMIEWIEGEEPEYEETPWSSTSRTEEEILQLEKDMAAVDLEALDADLSTEPVSTEPLDTEPEPVMHCGSRSLWKKRDESDMWWMALASHPWIEVFCRTFPDHVVFGEVFGQVQDLKYGAGPKDLFFRVFDVLDPQGNFWNHEALEANFTEVQRCPVIYKGPFDFKELQKLALGDSQVPGAKHMSEGIVIRPIKERCVFDPKPGETVDESLPLRRGGARTVLKLVSDRYLEKCE